MTSVSTKKTEFINKYHHHNKLLKNVKDSKEKNLVWILERERGRERQTDRQTDRLTERQTDRQTDRQTERDRETKNKKKKNLEIHETGFYINV